MQNPADLVQIQLPAGGSEVTGKQYWRSLNQLANTEKFREWVQNEFPSLAGDIGSGTSRRNLLKLMAASFGLAGLTACRRPVEHVLPNVQNAEGYVPGRPTFYATAMHHAGAATGLLVRSNDGRPTKVEGNPDHPFSLGATNTFHQASVLSLYDPDRLASIRANGQERKWIDFVTYAQAEFSRAKLGSGAGLRILSERVHSPSLLALRTQLLQTFPQAKWVEYDAALGDAAAEGAQLAFGQSVTPVYNLDKADVILSLDSDFLNCDSGGTVLPMKQFGRKRRATAESGEPPRLYVVEGKHSPTGTTADHRLRMRPSEIPAFAADLAGRLGVGGNQLQVVGQGGGNGKRSAWLNALVKDLNGKRGRSLVIAGPRQPAAVHALAALMNERLGNTGSTVTYHQAPAGDPRPQIEVLRELTADMAAGRVSHLVILGANPAYTAPADFEFEANIKKCANSVYLGPEFDETAAAAKWIVPEAHYLEAWGDTTAPDGTVTIQQPLIAPLYGGKSALEVIAVIAGSPQQSGYEIIRSYWITKFGGDPKATQGVLAPGTAPNPPNQVQGPVDNVMTSLTDAEKRWRKALHDGLIVNTAYPVANVTANAARVNQTAQQLPRTGQMELIFEPDPKVWDGRFANNAWLQELPDSMTSLTWDNAALVSPKTARDLGVAIGDVVKLERAGRSVEAPIMLQPGQAENLVVVRLGYGRKQCGRVGKGVGFNAYLIRTSDAMNVAGDIRVTKTGRQYPMSFTQEHHIINEPNVGNPAVAQRAHFLIREIEVEEYRREPEKVKEMEEVPELFQLYETPADWHKGNQWGMAIDLNACTGCNACVVACQAENNVPVVGKEQVAHSREMHWLRIDRYYKGHDDEEAEAVAQPMLCQQCENAPCENVCPVAATVHSPEGLNDMAYNRCVGTRYCSNNCPYKVRRFNFLNYHKDLEEVGKMVFNPDVTVRMRGVMEKCTYCVQRIQATRIDVKTRERRLWLSDQDNIMTACQQACPSEAIVFGNVNDPGSRVSQLKKLPRNYGILEELNTRPRTSYMARVRNPNPDLEAHHG